MSLSYLNISGQDFSKLLSYLGEKGLRTPPPSPTAHPHPQKEGFMDAASPRKHSNIYDLTATNAKLMKLTTSTYLHKKLHLAKDWGVTHRA